MTKLGYTYKKLELLKEYKRLLSKYSEAQIKATFSRADDLELKLLYKDLFEALGGIDALDKKIKDLEDEDI